MDKERGSSVSEHSPCEAGYGLYPDVHPAIARFARDVEEIIESSDPVDVPERVSAKLSTVLATDDLLSACHRECGDETYRRHVLYADPDRRFTILALIWKPGQRTTVHGHTAWGAVGVYEGKPNVTCYDCTEDDAGNVTPTQTSDFCCEPKQVTHVQPGLCGTHRIYNDTDDIVVTIHTYGRDLVKDPESINMVVGS